jgi:hypothetical protein
MRMPIYGPNVLLEDVAQELRKITGKIRIHSKANAMFGTAQRLIGGLRLGSPFYNWMCSKAAFANRRTRSERSEGIGPFLIK